MSNDLPLSLPSPCVAVCVLDPASGFCKGCFRTVEEIGGWLMMSNAERIATLDRLKERRAAAGLPTRRRNRRRGRQP